MSVAPPPLARHESEARGDAPPPGARPAMHRAARGEGNGDLMPMVPRLPPFSDAILIYHSLRHWSKPGDRYTAVGRSNSW